MSAGGPRASPAVDVRAVDPVLGRIVSAMGFGVARQLASSHNDIDGVAQLVIREHDLAVVRAIDLLAFVVIAVVFIVWTIACTAISCALGRAIVTAPGGRSEPGSRRS